VRHLERGPPCTPDTARASRTKRSSWKGRLAPSSRQRLGAGARSRLSVDGVLPPYEWRVTTIRDQRNNELRYSYTTVAGKVRVSGITHNRYPGRALARFDWTTSGDLDRVVTLPGYTANDPATGASQAWERTSTTPSTPPTASPPSSRTRRSPPVPTGAPPPSPTTPRTDFRA